MRIISRYRQIVNYDYWRLRAKIERTEQARDARKAIYVAERAFEKADLVTAKESFDTGLALWRKLIDKYPEIIEDRTVGDDLADVLQRLHPASWRRMTSRCPSPSSSRTFWTATARTASTAAGSRRCRPPVGQRQSRNPGEMWTVARDKNTAALKRRCRHDEIGIISRMAPFARVGPQVRSPVQHRKGYRQNVATTDKFEKGVQGPGGLHRA